MSVHRAITAVKEAQICYPAPKLNSLVVMGFLSQALTNGMAMSSTAQSSTEHLEGFRVGKCLLDQPSMIISGRRCSRPTVPSVDCGRASWRSLAHLASSYRGSIAYRLLFFETAGKRSAWP